MIPHNRPSLGEAEARAASEAVASGWVARGPQTAAFERELCAYLGLDDGCVAAVSSGTAALFLVLRTLEQTGAVAVPAYACAALANAAAMAGRDVVYADTAPGRPNPGAGEFAQTAAPLAVGANMYGVPGERASAPVFIDDAAQSLGATVDGVRVGTRGVAGIASFYATKLITAAGGGGAVISRDGAFMDAVRDYLDFDCRRDERRRFNFLMGDVQAAVGRVQLARFDALLQRRAELFERYRSAGIPLLFADEPGAVRYRAVMESTDPKATIARLERAGITAIVPTALWELPAGTYPNARALCERTVSLPVYPALRDAEIDAVCAALAA